MTNDITRLAPHVDTAWLDDFVIEQRLLDVPGDRIGEALLTVEAHVRDSGEGALEAFGDPRDYARELAEVPGAREGGLGQGYIVGLIMGLVGMLLVTRGASAVMDGGQVVVSEGDLVALGILAGLTLPLFAFSSTVLRWMMDRPLLLLLGYVIGFLGTVAAYAVFRDELTRIPAWSCLAAGLVGLLASVVTGLGWRGGDPVRDARPGSTDRPRTAWVTVLMFPILTALMVGMEMILRALG